MSKSHSSMRPAPTPVLRYGLAVVTVAIALGIKLILLRIGFPYPLTSSFLAAIAISFWFGGTGPGLLAVLLSSVAFGVFVMPYQLDYRLLLPDGSTKPVYLPVTITTTLPYLIYFLLVALIMSWFSASRRRAEGLLNQARNDLEVKVEERTADLRRANEELQAQVTERRRTEDSLHKAKAELVQVARVMTLAELVASIAHELNQPLGAIVTNGHACLRLLARDSPDLDRSREIIERMIKEGMRASDVIKRIRALLHKTPLEQAPLNINETVEEVIALLRRDLLSSEVELMLKLGGDLPPVIGDRSQLQQVILNLILNAKEAMSTVQGQPRELLVTTGLSESGEVLVAVRDSGTGLDPESVDRIFDPFFSTKPEGMGLGLSISQTIIEAHGGTLWATQNEGAGATIQFTLPLSSRNEP
jgi:C4-dicarboxylate-specific signal transduction histidine kinase